MMTPDDASRLREIERTLAVTRQRAEDHETDIRAFAPALVELAEMRADIRAIKVMVAQDQTLVRELSRKFDDSKKETANNRALIRVAAFGLAGTFLTSTGAVIAAILSGGP